MISSTACAFVFNAQTLHMRIHNHTRTRIAHHHRQNHHSHTLTQTAHTTTTLTLSTHFTYIQTPLSISSFIHPSSSHEYIHNMYVCNNTMYTMKCTHTHSTSSSITSLHPSTSPLTPSLFLLLHTHTHTHTPHSHLKLSYLSHIHTHAQCVFFIIILMTYLLLLFEFLPLARLALVARSNRSPQSTHETLGKP